MFKVFALDEFVNFHTQKKIVKFASIKFVSNYLCSLFAYTRAADITRKSKKVYVQAWLVSEAQQKIHQTESFMLQLDKMVVHKL